jgi:hypothetical protein
MTDAELVTCLGEALAGLLDGLDANTDPGRCGLSQQQWDRRVRSAREAMALLLADEPRDPAGDVGEEVLRALQSVQLDWQTAHALSTSPTISDMTWGRVARALQRLGAPAD